MRELKQSSVIWLVILLLGLSVFSIYRYAPLLKAKQELQKQNQEAKIQLAQLRLDLENLRILLEAEKTTNEKILSENNALHIDITKLQEDLGITQQELELLNSHLLALTRENVSLKEGNLALSKRLETTLKENEDMLAKIGSLEELKKMIAQIKRQLFENKRLLQRRLDEKRLADGNKGFVVKDGRATHQPKVYIEVKPAS